MTSENFPAGRAGTPSSRAIVLLEFDREVTAGDVLAEAARLGLGRPTYEDALYFGIEHAAAQLERPVVFLHEPWVGFFGRRDVVCLWTNAGRRELGLDGFDEAWRPGQRFAFVAAVPPDGAAR